MTGARVTLRASSMVWTETWERSTIIPNRFISFITNCKENRGRGMKINKERTGKKKTERESERGIISNFLFHFSLSLALSHRGLSLLELYTKFLSFNFFPSLQNNVTLTEITSFPELRTPTQFFTTFKTVASSFPIPPFVNSSPSHTYKSFPFSTIL